MKYTNIIFDLDGTLVDSSSSILDSFQKVFLANSLDPIIPLDSNIIGPPLHETLEKISGISDKAILESLAKEFKSIYDTAGYKNTEIFPGITNMLRNLKDRGAKIFIATNKRILPTMKIIDFLKWDDIFENVYSLDSFSPSANSKGEILKELLKTNDITEDVVYIGDREDDSLAAIENKIPYLMVSWGYDVKIKHIISKNYKTFSSVRLFNKFLL